MAEKKPVQPNERKIFTLQNIARKPQVFNLQGVKEGLHLSPGESRDIPESAISKEVKLAVKRDDVSLTEKK